MTRRAPNRRSVALTDRPGILFGGILAMLIGITLLYVAFTASDNGVPLRSYYNLTVQFRSLGGLGAHGADVRIAGKLVGQTQNARLVHGVPTVNLQINSSVGRLPVDTHFALRLRGLLGAEYVSIIPGQSRRTLPGGSLVGIRQTTETTQLFDVLNALGPRQRTGLGEVIDGLGDGLAGRGAQLNAALSTAPALLQNLQTALNPVLAQHGSITRLVSGSEALMAALDPVRAQMAAGFGAGTHALAPFATQAGSVERTLTVAPPALTGIHSSLSALQPTLASADRFAQATTRFTAYAPDALRALNGVLRGARSPLADAKTILTHAQATVPSVLTLAHTVIPILPETNRLLTVLEAPSALIGRYGCYLSGFAAGWRSFLGLAPPGNNGPLGPMTVLRVTLATPLVSIGSLGPLKTIRGGVTPSAAPCAGTGAAG
jgi:phospholipid/cholesterol/gamma-HCH transport system substrate-binding protein